MVAETGEASSFSIAQLVAVDTGAKVRSALRRLYRMPLPSAPWPGWLEPVTAGAP